MKKSIFLIILLAVLLIISACNKGEKTAPDIRVLHNGNEVANEQFLISWNGADYNVTNSAFEYILNYTLSSIPAAEDRNSYKISFDGKFPDSYSLSYGFYDQNGETIAGSSESYIEVQNLKDTLVFDFEDFVTGNYSSVSQEDFYIGFSLVCEWGANTCEYCFALKAEGNNRSTEGESESGNPTIEFNSSIYRTDYTGEQDLESPYSELIANYADLRAYCQENKNKFDFESESGAFNDIISKYDDNFFKKNLIVLLVFKEDSEKYELDVLSCMVHNGVLNINVGKSGTYSRGKPATWHIVVVLSKDAYSGEPISITTQNNYESTNDEKAFRETLYLLTDEPDTESGYENAFAFYPDGTYTVDLNNYNGFYPMDGKYSIENETVVLYDGTSFGKLLLEYNNEYNCYVFKNDTESGFGTMFDGTKLYICDYDMYKAVVDFHVQWNENASWEF